MTVCFKCECLYSTERDEVHLKLKQIENDVHTHDAFTIIYVHLLCCKIKQINTKPPKN